ncbi:hypothetical protein F511_20530 [Dorcoceras hygrometricum]|uniref:Uncharacterized protein n=1 Tax=Dorcoceras hygrometricum TaxID=472368 RepID=A0A2Z7D8P3_9LAMI|nr:hypothetical protein F511_20530 [Dorcoceras hygrometricum]
MFSNKLFNSCSLSCCLFFVTTLCATAVSFLRLVVAPLQFTSHLVFLFIAATGCPDVDLEVLETAGCPVVGREMLATGFPNDWLDQTMSYQLIQTHRLLCILDWLIILHCCCVWMAKRCRINLSKRHRAIAKIPSAGCTATGYFFFYDVASYLASLHNTTDSFCLTADCCSLLLIVMTSSLLLTAISIICADVITAVTSSSGCPVVGREVLATGFPNDWLDQTMSYQLIQTTSFAMHPRLKKYLLVLSSQDHLLNLLREGKTLSYQLIRTTSFCYAIAKIPSAGCTATGYFFFYDVASYLASLHNTTDSFCLTADCCSLLLIVMTSSLLLTAISIICADVITAVTSSC